MKTEHLNTIQTREGNWKKQIIKRKTDINYCSCGANQKSKKKKIKRAKSREWPVRQTEQHKKQRNRKAETD